MLALPQSSVAVHVLIITPLQPSKPLSSSEEELSREVVLEALLELEVELSLSLLVDVAEEEEAELVE